MKYILIATAILISTLAWYGGGLRNERLAQINQCVAALGPTVNARDWCLAIIKTKGEWNEYRPPRTIIGRDPLLFGGCSSGDCPD